MTRWQLSDADRKEVVKYRLEKANRTYQEAVGSIKNGYVETAANRLYYAAYYAVSALLISYTYEVSTHNGVMWLQKKHTLQYSAVVSKEQPFILKGAFGLYFFTSSSSIIFPPEHLAIILPRYNSCHQEPIICVREIASVD